MKKVIIFILIIGLTLSNAGAFAEAFSCSIYVEGEEIPADYTVITEDSFIFLPLRTVCQAIGAQVSWLEGYRMALVDDSDRSILVVPDSREAVLNNDRIGLNTAIKLIDGRIYVPIEFVEKCLSRETEVTDGSVHIGEKAEEILLNEKNNGKKIYALYHGFRRTRELDGDLGSWQIFYNTANSATDIDYINYNADLIDYQGNHQVASSNGNPVVGMLSERDEDYIEYKILLAKTAGLDGFMMDYVFPEHGNTVMIEDFLEVAEKYDFEIGVDWLDSSISWIKYYEGHSDIDTKEELTDYSKEIFQYAWDTVYSSPVAAQFNKRPLFFFFGGGVSTDEFRKIKAAEYDYPTGLGEPIYVRRGQLGGSFKNGEVTWGDLSTLSQQWKNEGVDIFSWIAPRYRTDRQAYLHWDKYGTLQDNINFLDNYRNMWQTEEKVNVNVATIWPGFDDRGCAAWGGGLFSGIDRMDGELYRRLWEYYIENKELIDIMFIGSWSDFTEGHEIEPTVTNGYREMITTQKYAAEFKDNPSDVNEDYLYMPQRLLELRKQVTKLKKIGFNTASISMGLDEAASAISSNKFLIAEKLMNAADIIVKELYDNVVAEKVNVKTIGIKHTPPPVENVEEYKEIVIKNEISRGKPVRTNSEQAIHVAANVVDGDTTDNSYWITADTHQVYWLEINLEKPYDISAIDLYAGQAYRLYSLVDFKFQYMDGHVWKDIPGAAMSGNTGTNTDIKFELECPVTASKVRLVCNDGSRAARVREIIIYEDIKKTVKNEPEAVPESQGSYDVENGLAVTVGDDILDKLYGNYYEGELSFEYWGDSTDKLLISSDTDKIATQKIGQNYGDFSIVAQITKSPSFAWEKCKVKLYSENIRFDKKETDGHIRFSGNALIKNPNITFTTYRIKNK